MEKDQLIFATGNRHKIEEAKMILGDYMEIKSSADVGCTEDIPETQDTLEGNALQKARYLASHYGVHCFSEDTGLEIAALGGAPGVHTARYAGDHRSAEDNMDLVLQRLEHAEDRSARFRTVIALIIDGHERCFEGIVNGKIATEKRGTAGFGYDPIFIPDGYERSFAELEAVVKNGISHRARAMAKLKTYLQSKAILNPDSPQNI